MLSNNLKISSRICQENLISSNQDLIRGKEIRSHLLQPHSSKIKVLQIRTLVGKISQALRVIDLAVTQAQLTSII